MQSNNLIVVGTATNTGSFYPPRNALSPYDLRLSSTAAEKFPEFTNLAVRYDTIYTSIHYDQETYSPALCSRHATRAGAADT